MTNNKIDFYVLKLKYKTGEALTLYDYGIRAFMPVIGVKEADSDTMIEVITGRRINKDTLELQNMLTYTNSRKATASDLHDMAEFLSLVKSNNKVIDAINVEFNKIEKLAIEDYQEYIDDLSTLTDYFVENNKQR